MHLIGSERHIPDFSRNLQSGVTVGPHAGSESHTIIFTLKKKLIKVKNRQKINPFHAF